MDAHSDTEYTVAVRPLKVVALLLFSLSTVLLIVCLSSSTWFSSQGFRTGLFEECVELIVTTPLPAKAPAPGSCQVISNRGNIYIPVVATIVVIGTALALVSTILTGIGLNSQKSSKKTLCYRIALFMSVLSVTLLLIGLVVFPVCFYMELKGLGRPIWDFEWCYGICWACVLLEFSSSLILLCDRENEEVYCTEKTILHNNDISVSEVPSSHKVVKG